MRVNEFSIGMGPCIWHKETEEAQYSIRLLPIGGFCALDGQDEDAGDERCLARQGFWKKFTILAGVSFMNLLTGIVIIAIRNGELIVLEDLPLYRGTYGERQNSFGLQVGAKQVPADFLTNLRFIGYQPLDFVQQMWFSIIQMMRGNVSVKEFSGPVGIMSIMTEVGTSSESSSSGWRENIFPTGGRC